MKAKPLKHGIDDEMRTFFSPCEPSEATHVELSFPGPFPSRILPVIRKGSRKGTGCWSWNGDTEKPTLKPSILTRGGIYDKDDNYVNHVCHCFVNDGIISFLDDCTHEFKGQQIPLLDVE